MNRWERASLLGALAVAALVVGPVLVEACSPQFEGPYPCNAGYASCATDDQCETSLADDPVNCGACNATCAMGALCQSGSCMSAPAPLATTLPQTTFAMNDTDVFFWSVTDNGTNLARIHKSSPGQVFTVTLPDGPPAPLGGLAVDDGDVYYWAGPDQVTMEGADGGTNVNASILSVPAPGGGALRAVASLGATSVSGNALALAGGTLVVFDVLAGLGPDLGVDTVPTSGGTPTQALSLQYTPTSLAIDANNVYTSSVPSQGVGCALQDTPLAGGVTGTIAELQGQAECPSALGSDGTSLYFATVSENYSSVCTVTIQRVPVAGGNPATVASVEAVENPLQIVIDGTNLYLATAQSVWRVPTSGGPMVRVAGSLAPSTPAPTCLAGAEYVTSPSVAIAVDAVSVYIAACPASQCTSVTGGAVLLQVPK